MGQLRGDGGVERSAPGKGPVLQRNLNGLQENDVNVRPGIGRGDGRSRSPSPPSPGGGRATLRPLPPAPTSASHHDPPTPTPTPLILHAPQPTPSEVALRALLQDHGGSSLPAPARATPSPSPSPSPPHDHHPALPFLFHFIPPLRPVTSPARACQLPQPVPQRTVVDVLRGFWARQALEDRHAHDGEGRSKEEALLQYDDDALPEGSDPPASSPPAEPSPSSFSRAGSDATPSDRASPPPFLPSACSSSDSLPYLYHLPEDDDDELFLLSPPSFPPPPLGDATCTPPPSSPPTPSLPPRSDLLRRAAMGTAKERRTGQGYWTREEMQRVYINYQ